LQIFKIKTAVISVLLILSVTLIFGQNSKIDSINKLIVKATTDTGRINLKLKKLSIVTGINLDSALAQGLKILEETKQMNYYRGEVEVRQRLASSYSFKGNYKAAADQLHYLEHFIKPSKDSSDFGELYGNYGLMYDFQNRYDTAIPFYEKAINILERTGNTHLLLGNYINIASAYQQESNYPMALLYLQKTLKISEGIKGGEIHEAYAYVNMAIIYALMNKPANAEQTYLKAIALGKKNELRDVELYAYSNLSSLYIDEKQWDKVYEFAMKAVVLGEQMGDQGIWASSLSRAATALANKGKFDSALIFSDKAIIIADSSGQSLNIFQAYSAKGEILKMQGKWKDAIEFYEKSFSAVKDGDIYTPDYGERYKELSECYEKTGNYPKALEAFKQAALIEDSVRSKDNIQKSTELTMNYEFDKKQQLQQAEQKSRDAVQKTKQVTLTFALVLMLALAIVAFAGFKNKQKANQLLRQQKEETEKTLHRLTVTQTQLVQSEKMASLGELTAGIAHEIQNPLNFVNNFSEVNVEMIEEFKTEKSKAENERDEKLEDELLQNISQNLEKILHHGKRADAIVKGMLQHSRTGAVQKESTDINALTNEYLRLSYHGIKAKDSSFNVTLKTDFDNRIGKINIIPQEIGRVILNIFNNAFYAVNEKAKQNHEDYKAVISVSTKKMDDAINITISDNGNGIPQKVRDKIFQPFFTTKPTGEGTGLGLSLSYDIITKAHGGEIKAETKEGEGTAFIISLPAND
jgi:two-component system, NtrC family, sensor kinase